MDAAGISHIGLVRKKNEDEFILAKDCNLFVICDGMGGHKGGKIASTIAAQIIGRSFPQSDNQDKRAVLNAAISEANQKIWRVGLEKSEFQEMGTTVTAAAIEDNRLVIAHVGDSSIFLLRENQIRKLTTDHTLARQMVLDGLLKETEMRTCSYNHILTRAVGVQEKVVIDNYTEVMRPGDCIIMCSDGLSDMLEEAEILSITNKIKTGADAREIAGALVNAALDKGGHDNITVIVLCI